MLKPAFILITYQRYSTVADTLLLPPSFLTCLVGKKNHLNEKDSKFEQEIMLFCQFAE